MEVTSYSETIYNILSTASKLLLQLLFRDLGTCTIKNITEL